MSTTWPKKIYIILVCYPTGSREFTYKFLSFIQAGKSRRYRECMIKRAMPGIPDEVLDHFIQKGYTNRDTTHDCWYCLMEIQESEAFNPNWITVPLPGESSQADDRLEAHRVGETKREGNNL